ncbi:MAG: DNA polymerase III subunit gamma/tau [Oscillospiraceae bacterium]|jgi:DNA polymerase-3 subunit gamma/tau|nr:DNA polymerase III subunit gamma/tau [Oscillospiraceae bacterium]
MYQVLYRKWRPKVFADVVGQPHITTTLLNEIKENRHSHAYLFTGSKGTGKTTCAKIFAKAVNCENPKDGDPCNECFSCRGIDQGSILDVIEIDAASNNGVDNIRDLREEVNFTPVSVKYRVYIIDEVHMLSIGAFNALLKTLEEPPAHVKFVLATTEVHKLPATIMSRCQRFDFNRIPSADIAKRLQYIAGQEGAVIETDAAVLISRLADGALRDALSILDQCIAKGGEITPATVSKVVGLAGNDYLFEVSQCIKDRNNAKALEILERLYAHSCDMERFCGELINHFRNIMIIKTTQRPQDIIVAADDEISRLKLLSNGFSVNEVLDIIDVLSQSLANLKKGIDRRIEMEMALIKLCSPGLLGDASSLIGRIELLEKELAEIKKTNPPKANDEPLQISKTLTDKNIHLEKGEQAEPKSQSLPNDSRDVSMQKVNADKPADEAEKVPDQIRNIKPDSVTGVIDEGTWLEVIRQVTFEDKGLIGAVNNSSALKDENRVVIKTDNILLKKFADMEYHRNAIKKAIKSVLGEELDICVTDAGGGDVPDNGSAPDPLQGFISHALNFDLDLNTQGE